MQLTPGRCQITGIGNFDRAMAVGGFDANNYDTYDILDYRRGDGTYNNDLLLTEARYKLACAISGNKLFTAGGARNYDAAMSDMVEVFDLSGNSLLSEEQLSVARMELSAAAVGDKVLFAGGLFMTYTGSAFVLTGSSDVVDIYDVPTGTWSVEHLSQARGGMSCAVLGGKAYFAGGYRGNNIASDRVDIYDAATGTWSTDTLSQARAFFGGGVAVGGRVFFAGGTREDEHNSDRIDIYDPATDAWTTAALSVPRCGVQAAVTGDFALFAGGGDDDMPNWSFLTASDRVDIYNAGTDQWSTANMSSERVNFAAAASGNQVYLFGGIAGDFATFPTVVDVFTDASAIGFDEPVVPSFSAWPNPSADRVTIGLLDAMNGATAELLDGTGRRCAMQRIGKGGVVDLAALPDGPYIIRLLMDDGRAALSTTLVKGR